MNKIYADMIISKANGGIGIDFDIVPASRRAEVKAELNARGYGTDGKPLPVVEEESAATETPEEEETETEEA